MERDIRKWHEPKSGRITFVAATPSADLTVGCVGYIADIGDDNSAGWVHLSVDPEMRGFGIGRKLGKIVVDKAIEDGKETVQLVTTAAHDSIGFYEKLGFKLKRVRNKFIGSIFHCVRVCEFVLKLNTTLQKENELSINKKVFI